MRFLVDANLSPRVAALLSDAGFASIHVADVNLLTATDQWTGVLEPLNDPAYYAQVVVDPEAGTMVWPGGIDLAPEPLYEQAKAHPLAAT
jgi:hypothetical protein